MRMYMIRHGQTVANREWFFAGQSDVPLTELGRQQAEELRPLLENVEFDGVYASDLSRAVDTQRLAIPGREAQTTPLLREFDVGSLTGRNIDDCSREYGKLGDYRPFGGESKDDVCDRVAKFLEQLQQTGENTVAVFVHNGVMKSMLRLVLGTEYARGAVANDNCNVAVFDYDGKKWSLLAWNLAGRF